MCFLATSIICVHANGPFEFLRSLIQNNLAGPPVIHKRTEWNFDPDVGVQRGQLFQLANGYRGERLVERLGLGLDGQHDARLVQQRARDSGLLGGTIHQIKSDLNTIDSST